MNTSSFLIMTLVAVTCIFGFSTFGVDLGTHYDADFSSNITTTANQTLGKIENITNTFQDLFNQNSTWEQTAFSIFFTLPANIISAMVDIPTFPIALLQSAGTDMGGTLPWWVLPIIRSVLTIIIFMIIISILFNRSDT